MLVRLAVRDFRVVTDLEFTPGPGLCAITGETGAGKSVLVGALEAALGQEVDGQDVRPPAEHAVVTAEFSIPPDPVLRERVRELLPEWEGNTLTLERKIHRSGRSSCRINGKPVPRETLVALGDWLVDIHGQHAHQLLLSEGFQLDVLDAFAGLWDQRLKVGQAYRSWVELKRRVRDLRAQVERATREAQERAFALAELEAARLEEGEKEALERELRLLATAHRYKALCQEAQAALLEEDDAIVPRLLRLLRGLKELGAHFPDLATSLQAAESAVVDIQELAHTLQRVDAKLKADPARQEEVEQRLGLLVRLEKKYGRDQRGLLDLLAQWQQEACSVEEERRQLAEAEQALEAARESLEELASQLSAARLRALERLVPLVEQEFAVLGLERARFLVRLEPLPVRDGFAGDARGKERALFLFASSPGEEPRELARVASGGELSRIMLALKTVVGSVDPVETMVFDEIDTGVGGGLARVVGQRLRRLGAHRQVICVTHLAYVASLAHRHFVVEKEATDRIHVRLREKRGEERIKEIARMLGGFPLTEEALLHARAMVEGESQESQGGTGEGAQVRRP